MKDTIIQALFIGSGLCLLTGLVMAGLAFKGNFGFSDGESDVMLSLVVDAMWELYLICGLIICGIIGLAVAIAIWLKNQA